ncbi:hypothetical protein Pan216_21300 [Planctomycetes bacterium Pan216]|uniref:Helix-turn-helix domain protein n=1 Tax=Kolteria novifilia TaxID=2527975 RepID=A0A518B2W5_9BACT|nr:hypothetical protein Pan216_21300 [Planctomycetes bacterium Pan216]
MSASATDAEVTDLATLNVLIFDRLEVIAKALTDTDARILPRFLSKGDAARYAGISEASIEKLLSMRMLKPYRPVKRRTVVDRLELEQYVLSTQPR